MDSSDLRADPRYRANAPYTRVVVRPAVLTEVKAPTNSEADAGDRSGSPHGSHEGHAYDLSARGVRFELDEAVPNGTAIQFELELPGCSAPVKGRGRVVRVFSQEDDPGPRRMAAHIEEFASEHDRMRLAAHLEDHWLSPEL